MPRLLLIGDVGGPSTYHVGDEAMLAANLDELREIFTGSLEATVVSAAPEWTARRYAVRAVEPLGFPRAGDTELIGRIVDEASTGETTKPAIAALADSDALVLSGGGNINSTWRDHLHERVALMGAAGALGKPCLVLGQTLGPRLFDDDRRLLRATLPAAAFVGVRELDSFRLALRLGVPLDRLRYQLDDAAFLSPSPAPEVELPGKPWIAITLSGAVDGNIEEWAAALETLHRRTACPLVFVPHAAAPDDDARLGDALAERLHPILTSLPLLTDRQVAGITRRAAMVVSSRYHPLVFAAAGGVPVLGLYTDDYTRVKLRGALRHAGLEDWILDRRLVPTPMFLAAAEEVWARREEIAAHLGRRLPAWEAVYRNHWTMIRRRIEEPASRRTPRLEPVPRPVPDAPRPRGWWPIVAANDVADADVALWREIELAEQREDAESYARSLREVLTAREEELANLKALMTEMQAEAERADVSTPGAPAGKGAAAADTSEQPPGGRLDPPA